MEKSDLKNKENKNNLNKEEIIDNYNIENDLKDINDNNIYLSNINIEKEKEKNGSSFISKASTKKSSKKLLNKKTFLINMFDKDNKNINYIHEILNEFKERNSLIQRTDSMPELSYTNLFKSTEKEEEEHPTSILVDKKSNIKELNDLNVIIGFSNDKIIGKQNENEEERMTIINIDKSINESVIINYNNNSIQNKNEEEGCEKYRSKSVAIKEKEMSSHFSEENEHKNNIIYNNITNKIERISSNLLLQKIIFEDFLKKNADSIYHFCQQCFCFIKTDIFFSKILNCYKHYRKKNIPIEKIINLIDFLNALIIEMFEYYKGIPKDDDIQLIRDIYNTILSDLIINNNYNNNIDIKNENDKRKIISSINEFLVEKK